MIRNEQRKLKSVYRRKHGDIGGHLREQTGNFQNKVPLLVL